MKKKLAPEGGAVLFFIELLPFQHFIVLIPIFTSELGNNDTQGKYVKNLSLEDFISSLKLLRFEQISNYEGSTHSCRW